MQVCEHMSCVECASNAHSSVQHVSLAKRQRGERSSGELRALEVDVCNKPEGVSATARIPTTEPAPASLFDARYEAYTRHTHAHTRTQTQRHIVTHSCGMFCDGVVQSTQGGRQHRKLRSLDTRIVREIAARQVRKEESYPALETITHTQDTLVSSDHT